MKGMIKNKCRMCEYYKKGLFWGFCKLYEMPIWMVGKCIEGPYLSKIQAMAFFILRGHKMEDIYKVMDKMIHSGEGVVWDKK